VSSLFIGGPEMSVLKNALPVEIHTEYRQSTEELLPLVIKAVRPGDVIMVKSSKGIGFSKIVKAFTNQFPPVEPAE
jgi:UDP-N-acetylmuramoyl-tripeptide--D-alanyl-D-alanine ligase